MTVRAGAESPASPQVAEPTDRMLMARAALDAALAEAGVMHGHDGGDGRYATPVDAERLPGVVVVAERGGRYSVDLYLTAALVPLEPLADRIRQGVEAGVASIGLEERLGDVNVNFLAIENGAAP